MKFKKKAAAVALSVCLVFTFSTGAAVYGTSISEQQQELEDVESNRDKVEQEMNELVDEIEDGQSEIDQIQNQINQKIGEINEATASIQKTEKEIAESETELNKRLRVMYKNGSVGFLDVLFGSNSLSEFLSNVEMIQRIYENDQDTITTLQEQQAELKQKRESLKKEQEALDAEKQEAQEKKDALDVKKRNLQDKLDDLNAEAQRIGDLIKELQAANRNKQPEYTGSGQFMWPTDSRYITSEFGGRIHPITGIYTGHTGIDIGASYGDPVYAAESGTVILADWYGGYGYAVIIDHGSGISTLYGHNSSLSVSAGQTVSRGQVIANVGSTGWSTGPHCHFEVRVNGEYVNPMGYL